MKQMTDTLAQSRLDALALRLDLLLEQVEVAQCESHRLLAAYDLAAAGHSGQLRGDGSPYLSKCVEVALSLKASAADIDTVVAGLIMDLEEDTGLDRREMVQTVGQDPVTIAMRSREAALAAYRLPGSEGGALLTSTFADVRIGAVVIHDSIATVRQLIVRPMQTREARHVDFQQRFAAYVRDAVIPAANAAGLLGTASELELLTSLATDARFEERAQRFRALSSAALPTQLPSRDAWCQAVAWLPVTQSLIKTPSGPAVPPDSEVLRRLAQIDAALTAYKAPKVADLLGGFMGVNLKGVWLWAEHLLRTSRRAARHRELRSNVNQPSAADADIASALLAGSESAADDAASAIARRRESP